MRLLPALLATLLASTTVIQTAAACGGYVEINPAPRVLAVSTHSMMIKDRWGERAFIVLEQSAHIEGNAKWQALAPGTYDGTQIMTLAPLAKPIEATLVGPSGTRVVKTDKQVALGRSWQIGWDQRRVALEVPLEDKDQFSIAIAGRAADATWHALDYSEAPASTKWWLAKLGVKPDGYVGLRAIDGTQLEVVEYSTASTTQFVVRQNDNTIGAAQGSALGAVTTGGRTFLVYSINHQIGLLELPAASVPAATTRA